MNNNRFLENKRYHDNLINKFNWIYSIRPLALINIFIKLFAPNERRRIVETNLDIKFYIDPFTSIGRSITLEGIYNELDTIKVFQSYIKNGYAVLDIGANEGFFSILAGKLVGKEGMVIAIEPQSSLIDIIDINFRLNNIVNYKIFHNAFGESDNKFAFLNLRPAISSAPTSLVKKYRFCKKHEKVEFISIKKIFEECNLDVIDFIKIDVEGYEHKAIYELIPYIRLKKIKMIYVDYHSDLLSMQSISPADIHNILINNGMTLRKGDIDNLTSYFLYTLSEK